jgi:uncharacterized membrane protein YciS (DUF1049 family)
MNTPDTYLDLFFGYTMLWLLLVFFVFKMNQSQREVANKLKTLEHKMQGRLS